MIKTMWPGIPELLLILVIVLIIFGPGKLPQLGEALGKAIRSFRKSSSKKQEIDVTPKKTEIKPPEQEKVEDAEVSVKSDSEESKKS